MLDVERESIADTHSLRVARAAESYQSEWRAYIDHR
jgi:hypothetical protein